MAEPYSSSGLMWMRRSLRRLDMSIIVAVVAIVVGTAGCGANSTKSAPADSTGGLPPVSTAPSSASGSSDSGDLRVVLCVPDLDDWTTFDLSTRQLAPTPLNVPAARKDNCSRYITASAGNGTNGTVAGLYVLSHNLRDVAEAITEDQDDDAGYQPATDGTLRDSGSFTDVSGNNPNDFAQKSENDGQVLFNPVTGKLWWRDQDSGDLFSNTVPPGSPVNEGPGFLFTFTPSGDPMPLAYYDSPDGTRRAVLVPDERGNVQIDVGATSSMTPRCLQDAEVAALSEPGIDHTLDDGFCGSSQVVDAAGEGAPDSACATFVGWISATAVACVSQDSTGLDSFPITSNGKLGNPIDLLPSTTKTIDDALVTPDGDQVMLFMTGNEGIGLYLIPTTTTQNPATPISLRNWGSGNEATDGILGWILPNGRWEV